MTFGAWPHGRSGGGGAPAKIPALQPLNGAQDAWALQALNGSSQVNRVVGRPGMGTLLSNFGANIPSPVPGQTAPYTNGTTADSSFNYQSAVDPVPLLASGYTFCFKLLRATNLPMTDSAYPESWTILWSTGAILFLPFGYNIATGDVRATTAPGGISPGLTVPLGKWCFCSVAVDAATNAEFGVDGVYKSVTGVAPNTGSITTVPLRIFGDLGFGTNFGRYSAQALSDIALWTGKKSQAFCEKQRHIGMGL